MTKPTQITLIVAIGLLCLAVGYTAATFNADPSLHQCAQLFPNKGRFGALIDMEVVARPDVIDISSLSIQLRGGTNRLLDDDRVKEFLRCLETSADQRLSRD